MEETTQEQQSYTTPSWMMWGARILSLVVTPMIIPFLAFAAIFVYSPLRYMFARVQLILLGIVFCFTILLPAVTILLYKAMHRYNWNDLLLRRTRFVPYAVTIISYGFCLVMLQRLHIAQHLVVYGYIFPGIILSVLVCLTVCILVNLKWKISVHMAGIGGAVGMLVAISTTFGQNQVFALCALILLSGCLGTSRILLGRHTFYEVISGFTVGLVCSMLILMLPASTFLLRLFF